MTLFSALRVAATTKQINLAPVSSRGSWFPLIRESFTGAWQQNTDVVVADVVTYAAVYACITLIAQDIGKLRIKLVEQDTNGIWEETDSAAFSPVLRKPNRYQTRIKFLENWIVSKLIWGNTYVLKQRDLRGVVTALYILDPQRVTVLVAPDGSVFYQIKRDDLSSQPQEEITAPASEIIHDVNCALYHPLVGVSPITACGLAAMQGLRIQDNSSIFFENGAQPGGFLTAPGAISNETAQRLKAYWDANFSGANRGKVAVGGDGLKYEQLSMSAVDSQLIEQLRWTIENVAMAFHMPLFRLGIGQAPPYGNYQAVKQDYYEACLHPHIESIELLLDEGLGLTAVQGKTLGTELDLDNLLRMDTAALIDAEAKAVGAGISAPNEARKRLNAKPVDGGETPFLQQQNWPIKQLANRDDPDAQPAARGLVAAPPPAALPPAPDDADKDDRAAQKAILTVKVLERLRAA